MRTADLVRQYPRLFHMAEDGSWPSIARHGLLSTHRLLDLYDVPAARRTVIEAAWRPEKVRLEKSTLGTATIRDQKPLPPARLTSCLRDGLTPEQWYRHLNRRVFFWLTSERLERLLQARAYRHEAQTVLELDAATLIGAYEAQVELSPINSGAAFPMARPRGLSTFQSIAEFSAPNGPAELSILDGIPDVAAYVVRVDRRLPGGTQESLYKR